MIDPSDTRLPISRQCELLGINRSNFYYEQAPETVYNLVLMNKIDELYTEHPALGSRQMSASLKLEGYNVNRKRIQRLMRIMGIEGICPHKKLRIPNSEHKIYPYLLRNMVINRPFQVWSTDITYIRMREGFLFLTAVIDWYSRFVLAWNISNTMTTNFCTEALIHSFEYGLPEIFNTDQGTQFTSSQFVNELTKRKIQVSMDGRKRALDNIFIERLWRTVKYEEVYLKDYSSCKEAQNELKKFFDYYNNRRPHSSLGGKTPRSVFEK